MLGGSRRSPYRWTHVTSPQYWSLWLLGAVQQLRNAQWGGGVRDAIRSVVKVSVKKGEGGKNRKKKLLLKIAGDVAY